MNIQDIALALLNARKEKGVTQQQLADMIGVSKPTISLMENGKQNITIDLLCRVCNALDIELALNSKDVNSTIAEITRLAKSL